MDTSPCKGGPRTPGPHWVKSSLSFSNGNCVEVAWQKSSQSTFNGNCVEAGTCPHGILVRDSKHPDGPVLAFTPAEWDAFLGGVRLGEFDGFTGA